MKKNVFIITAAVFLALIAIYFYPRVYPASTPGQNSGDAIAIRDFSFDPSTLTVPVGTSVTWTNRGGTIHRIASETFNSPDLPPTGSYSHTFMLKGVFDYACSLHPAMRGTIIVQ